MLIKAGYFVKKKSLLCAYLGLLFLKVPSLFVVALWDWGKILTEIKERGANYCLIEMLDYVYKPEDVVWMEGNATWVANNVSRDLSVNLKVRLASEINKIYLNYYNFERFLSRSALLRNGNDFSKAILFLKAIFAKKDEREPIIIKGLLDKRKLAQWLEISKDGSLIVEERLNLLVDAALRTPRLNLVRRLRSVVVIFLSVIEGLSRDLEAGKLLQLKKSVAARETLALDFAWEVVSEIRKYGKKMSSNLFAFVDQQLSELFQSSSNDRNNNYHNEECRKWVHFLLLDYYLPAEWLFLLSKQNAGSLSLKIMACSLLGELAECCSFEHMINGALLDKFIHGKAPNERVDFVAECLCNLIDVKS